MSMLSLVKHWKGSEVESSPSSASVSCSRSKGTMTLDLTLVDRSELITSAGEGGHERVSGKMIVVPAQIAPPRPIVRPRVWNLVKHQHRHRTISATGAYSGPKQRKELSGRVNTDQSPAESIIWLLLRKLSLDQHTEIE